MASINSWEPFKACRHACNRPTHAHSCTLRFLAARWAFPEGISTGQVPLRLKQAQKELCRTWLPIPSILACGALESAAFTRGTAWITSLGVRNGGNSLHYSLKGFPPLSLEPKQEVFAAKGPGATQLPVTGSSDASRTGTRVDLKRHHEANTRQLPTTYLAIDRLYVVLLLGLADSENAPNPASLTRKHRSTGS